VKQKEGGGTNQPIAPGAKVPIDTWIRTRESVCVSFRRVIDVRKYRYTWIVRERNRESFVLVRNYTGDEQCEDESVVGLVGVSGSSLKYDV